MTCYRCGAPWQCVDDRYLGIYMEPTCKCLRTIEEDENEVDNSDEE
jgi:hypothetical protein